MKSVVQFERVACVSLKRRPDRWDRFQTNLPDDWPFKKVERFNAVDGNRVPAPAWFRPGSRAWGCYKSHLNILESCLQNGVDSCLFLEDDAVFCEDFSLRVRSFMSQVPDDWGMIYLGGQHLNGRQHPPIQIKPDVYIPYDVNRTHAFAVRGQPMMRKLYRHLNAFKDWIDGHHIDHHLGQFHRQRANPVYCPAKWLVGQAEGRSDICGKNLKSRYFPDAESYQPVNIDFICVLGLHRSGSSCVAMMLHKLGVHMGDQLTGYKSVRGGGEAADLARICETAMPFPETRLKCRSGELQAKLLDWIRDRQQESDHFNSLAGGKYPHLCAFGSVLETTLKGNMKVIHTSRPLEESIESLVKQEPMQSPRKLTELQKYLWDCKQDFLQKTNVPVLSLEYEDILSDPAQVVDRIIRFLDLAPTADQREDAIAHVQPKHRHHSS